MQSFAARNVKTHFTRADPFTCSQQIWYFFINDGNKNTVHDRQSSRFSRSNEFVKASVTASSVYCQKNDGDDR